MMNQLQIAYRRAFSDAYGWSAARLYHELAWAYDGVSRLVSGGRWDAWRRLALDYVNGPRVLELGFGTGELLLEMRRQGFAAAGLDLSRPMHRVAGRKAAERGIGAPRVLARAQALPFASATFRTVVSTFPADYILQQVTLREVRRVLAPGGRLVIVGLFVQLPRSLRQPLSVAPDAPVEQLWSHLEGLAAGAGLSFAVVWREDGRARVPVVLCARPEERR